MKLVQDRLNEVEMELTRLRVEGTGITSLSTLPVLSFASVTPSTTCTVSSVLHDPQEVRTGHVDFLRQTSVTSNVLFLQSGMMQSTSKLSTNSQQHTGRYLYQYTVQPTQWQPHGLFGPVGPSNSSGMNLVTNPYVSLSNTLFYSRPISSIGTTSSGFPTVTLLLGHCQVQRRRGKAPPIDEFTAEDSQITIDDWILILEHAASWNGWTEDESLMQLAGHLRGQALLEWKLLDSRDKATYHSAIKALRERLDPGNQSIAALDFQHTSQKPSETISGFIWRLEKVFQTAFGHENLSAETRDMLLYGQLQEGLSYTLMEFLSVSGSQNYRELCVAAKKEERGWLS